jgi:hypothetical protein
LSSVFQGDFADSGAQNVVFGWFFVGQIVVKTWFLSVTIPPLKIFHFFEIYFSPDVGDGQFAATPGKPAHTPGTLSETR